MRRVVTGHDDGGRAHVLIDDEPKAKCCCARATCWCSRARTTLGATAATGPRASLSCSLMRKADLALIALVLALAPLPAGTQDYPSKPIRYIVATAPGGLMDLA